MLKDYLSVAQDALRTQKELYHVKEQRLALALDEYVRLNDAYKEKSSSRTSLFSGSSSSTKYDPDILKAEISTTRLRVKKLKRELSQMKQELLYKEQGFATLKQIDKKMSGGQSGYELSEAKAILTELKSIRKAISSGEKEKQDLMQSLAKLQERFHLDQSIGRSEPDLRSSPVNSHLSLSRQTLDAGSQTSISGDIGVRSRSNLAEKVRLSLQYEEAKRSMANLKIELSKLDSEAWPGALDVEKEKLMLINEKEELLKELQFVTPQKRTPDELESLGAERRRLEEELRSVRGAPSRALAESLSASTLSMSSGSSLGSLASSRGSLNTSSRGSLNSLSSSELYYTSQGDQLDPDYQYKLDFLLQEKGGYIPSGPITTIHEHEVAKSPSQPGQSGPCGAAAAAPGHAPTLTEAPKSVTSLSSRSSLSSLSPPGSPLVLEGAFPLSPHDVPLHQFSADFEDCELSSHFADIGLGEDPLLLDSDPGGVPPSLSEDKDLTECAREPPHEGPADVEKSLPKRRGIHLLGEKTACVSAAVSDESVAGDSGVYEAFVKQPSEVEDVLYSEEDVAVMETAQVQIGLRLTMLREASDEIVAEEGAEVKLAEGSCCAEDVISSCPSVPEMNEDTSKTENNCANDLGSQPAAGVPALVDKETNTDEAGSASVAVRPKDRSGLSARQRPFVRSSVIVRSQTFSPGERSQYVCRLNRSDSDSSTLAKKSLFVRNSTERRSLRVKRAVCQPVLRRAAPECPVRTSLDLELDLQASLTRQSRLNDELQALRGLRQKLEDLKAQGETDLPPGVLEDERFQKLLRQAEKQAEQSREEQKQDLNAEKLMRQVSKDVCRLREQSRKVPRQVQSFREKIAYFTRAKISIPSLPADDV
ncbi:hypothetical protein J1605_016776 [Eschrichtius robustus]|uniref:WWC1-like helical hairpin domain-containing protein n=1 Tax=Eschrichtius robustus TaxID=9764 RepID=A0AB34I797_ESCRO|nr:hypothetical protein J1605_016776 [Eschrichtius robustus]